MIRLHLHQTTTVEMLQFKLTPSRGTALYKLIVQVSLLSLLGVNAAHTLHVYTCASEDLCPCLFGPAKVEVLCTVSGRV